MSGYTYVTENSIWGLITPDIYVQILQFPRLGIESEIALELSPKNSLLNGLWRSS